MFSRILLLIPACVSLALAQEKPSPEPKTDAEPPAEAAKPSVKKIDETHYQVGLVTFDQKTREIRFPAQVNMIEGQLEFLVVHKNGKVHESLFSTEISPTHLNLAFTLLRYPPSRELYSLPNEAGGGSDKFPDVPADVKAAARVGIEVEWTDDGKVRRVPVNEWIQHGEKTTAMPVTTWVYGGSEFYEGKYIPETCGDIIAIYLASSAILNYPGDDNNNDDVWTPFPKRVPAVGSKVTVIITPNQKTPPLPKP